MFLLGFVPPEEDAQFGGMLSIPYMTPAKCVGVKYRNLRPDAEPRYTQPSGQETHLYNVLDVQKPSTRIVICEGEIDAMTVSMLGIPAVGVPGTHNWKGFYYRIFDGYKDIVVLTDNDVKTDGSNPGQELARTIFRDLMGARNVVLPPGRDANSFFLEEGEEALLKLIGVSP